MTIFDRRVTSVSRFVNRAAGRVLACSKLWVRTWKGITMSSAQRVSKCKQRCGPCARRPFGLVPGSSRKMPSAEEDAGQAQARQVPAISSEFVCNASTDVWVALVHISGNRTPMWYVPLSHDGLFSIEGHFVLWSSPSLPQIGIFRGSSFWFLSSFGFPLDLGFARW